MIKGICLGKLNKALNYYRPHPKDGGGYCFQFVCQFTSRGGGVPQSGPGGIPHPKSGWMGVPMPGLARGYPIPGLGGGGGTPSQVWTGVPGVPPNQVWMGYPPRPGMGYSPQTWDGVPPRPGMGSPLDLGGGTPRT